MAVKTDEEIASKLLSNLLAKQYSLILYDDPKITQELVLSCLIKYCNQGLEQGIQCISIIENKGKYAVKQGTLEILAPIYTAFIHNKLTCEIL